MNWPLARALWELDWCWGAAAGRQPHPRARRRPKKPAGIAVGYAAITWGDKSVKTAMEEIAAAGYPGIQLRKNILDEYKEPAALKADLDRLKLTFACVSGGGPLADPAKRQEEVDKFMVLAKFAREAGALAIQATSPNRNGRPTIDPAELKAFAETLNEIGKRCTDLGFPLAFHPHMNQIGEKPDEVEVILGAADPKHVQAVARHRPLGSRRRRPGQGGEGSRQADRGPAHQGCKRSVTGRRCPGQGR